MFLHIGNNKTVREREIIGIFDADTATVSPVTRKYLTAAQKRGEVFSAREEIPKSFLLLKSNGRFCVFFSQISTAALAGRTENSNFEMKKEQDNKGR